MNFKDDDGIRKVFDLSSPMQMLAKLQWENDQVKSMLEAESPNVVFAAFNAAASAWHLIDWVKTFSRVHPNLPRPNIDVAVYRNDAISRCPELSVCRQLSVGWKHRVIDNHNNPHVQALHVIDFFVETENGFPKYSASPPRIRRRPALYCEGQAVSLDVFFERVTQFWSAELARLQFK